MYLPPFQEIPISFPILYNPPFPKNDKCLEVGGPMVVGLLTPQRNAMTLAAKEWRSPRCHGMGPCKLTWGFPEMEAPQ